MWSNTSGWDVFNAVVRHQSVVSHLGRETAFFGARSLITRGRNRISFSFTEVESDTGSIGFFPLVSFVPLLCLLFHPSSGGNSAACVCWCVILPLLTYLSVILSSFFVFLFIFLLSFLTFFSASVNASYLWCTLGGFVTFWCVCMCVLGEGGCGGGWIHCFTLRCLCDTSISWKYEAPKSHTHAASADPSRLYCWFYCIIAWTKS